MKLKILMTTEGTYPFHHGGVSTWCHSLVNNLGKDNDFYIYSVIMNPYVTQKFSLPKGAKLIKVPLWGTEEPGEHLDIPFSKVFLTRKRTEDKIIREKFIPLFIDMIDEIISPDKNPEQFGKTLRDLYLYFQDYDYKTSFKAEITWETYKEHIKELSKDKAKSIPSAGVYSQINSLGWIYRFMTILNTPIPEVDVTHSSAAAFCGIPCVIAKLQYNTPFLLTEHGVYLREQYLSLSQKGYPSFLSMFFIRLVHSIVGLNYHYADQVSPVCSYNTRWEKRFGVEEQRIKVIYNGVDNHVFFSEESSRKSKYPTVAAVARIDPVKDIITLIKTAAVVKETIPEVRFVVYGSVSVEEYYKECLKLKEELKLGDNFIFAGHTSDVAAVYRSCDIVVLSSITEAFPYSVVEAMMSGKPVIATDVGGVKEALGSCGVLVTPRNVEEFSSAVIKLLCDPELRTELSSEGTERALNNFTISRVNSMFNESYVKLGAVKASIISSIEIRKKQQLYLDRALALLELRMYEAAIEQFRYAILLQPNAAAVPFMLAMTARAYQKLHDKDKELIEIQKAEIISDLINSSIKV